MNESSTDFAAASAIDEAYDFGHKVQYLHIETPINKTVNGSEISKVIISEFDI